MSSSSRWEALGADFSSRMQSLHAREVESEAALIRQGQWQQFSLLQMLAQSIGDEIALDLVSGDPLRGRIEAVSHAQGPVDFSQRIERARTAAPHIQIHPWCLITHRNPVLIPLERIALVHLHSSPSTLQRRQQMRGDHLMARISQWVGARVRCQTMAGSAAREVEGRLTHVGQDFLVILSATRSEERDGMHGKGAHIAVPLHSLLKIEQLRRA